MPTLGFGTHPLRRAADPRRRGSHAPNSARARAQMDESRESPIRLPNLNKRWPDFDALLVSPPEGAPRDRGLVIFSDIFGHATEPMRSQAHRFARDGFWCIVPDLFDGSPWPLGTPASSPDFERWRSRQATPYERIWDVGDTCRDHMVASVGVAKCGAVGYCIGGGRLAEAFARDGDDRYSAGVAFYGTRIDPAAVAAARAPVLFVFGELDGLVPAEVVEEVRRGVQEQPSEVRGKVEVFAGQGHAFAHSAALRDAEDAGRALNMAVEWLNRHMG